MRSCQPVIPKLVWKALSHTWKQIGFLGHDLDFSVQTYASFINMSSPRYVLYSRRCLLGGVGVVHMVDVCRMGSG